MTSNLQSSVSANGVCNDNTEKLMNTKWAINHGFRCVTGSAGKKQEPWWEISPADLLTSKPTAEKPNHWLCRFMVKVYKLSVLPLMFQNRMKVLQCFQDLYFKEWTTVPLTLHPRTLMFTFTNCSKLWSLNYICVYLVYRLCVMM